MFSYASGWYLYSPRGNQRRLRDNSGKLRYVTRSGQETKELMLIAYGGADINWKVDHVDQQHGILNFQNITHRKFFRLQEIKCPLLQMIFFPAVLL